MVMIMNNVANAILKKNTENINNSEVDLIPCNTGVILEPYDDNPYRKVERTESGLIIGVESTQKYKSNDTGEMESNEEYIACAKVIAVGPSCKFVQPGEDVFYVKHIAIPVPFRKKGYWTLSEQNIICRIVKKKEND